MELITATNAALLDNEKLLEKIFIAHKDSITQTKTDFPVLREELLRRLNSLPKKGIDETDAA